MSDSPVVGTAARRWLTFAVISAAEFMIVTDNSVVNTMDPRLARVLGLSTITLQWVMNIYILLSGGLRPLGGRLADILGRRRVFVAGAALFAVSSLAAGLSQNSTELLTARAVQGIASAAIAPSALSILVTTFTDPAERNRVFGIWETIIGVAMSVGVIIGGALTDIDWRWVFWFNVPIGVIVVIAAFPLIPAGRPSGPRPPSDLAGAVTVTLGLLGLVYGIVTGSTNGWTSPRTAGALLGGAALIGVFVAVERRSRAPLMPLRLFRRRALVAGAAGELLVGGMMMPAFFLLPLYLQDLRGYSALGCGLAMQPVSVVMILAAPMVGRTIGRVGARVMYLVGTLSLAGMFVFVVRLTPSDGYWSYFLPAVVLFGFGLVLCLISTSVVGTSQATEQDAGTTAAVLNTSSQLGEALGIAIAATVLNSWVGHQVAHGTAYPDALAGGIRVAFMALLGVLALSLLNSLIGFRGLGRRARSDKPAEARLEDAAVLDS